MMVTLKNMDQAVQLKNLVDHLHDSHVSSRWHRNHEYLAITYKSKLLKHTYQGLPENSVVFYAVRLDQHLQPIEHKDHLFKIYSNKTDVNGIHDFAKYFNDNFENGDIVKVKVVSGKNKKGNITRLITAIKHVE